MRTYRVSFSDFFGRRRVRKRVINIPFARVLSFDKAVETGRVSRSQLCRWTVQFKIESSTGISYTADPGRTLETQYRLNPEYFSINKLVNSEQRIYGEIYTF